MGGGGAMPLLPAVRGNRGPYAGRLPDYDIEKIKLYMRIKDEQVATPLTLFGVTPGGTQKIVTFVLRYDDGPANPLYELMYDGASVEEVCNTIVSLSTFADPDEIRIVGLIKRIFHPLFDDQVGHLNDIRTPSPLIFEHGNQEDDPVWGEPVYRCTAILRGGKEDARRRDNARAQAAMYNQAQMAKNAMLQHQTQQMKNQIAQAQLAQNQALYTVLLSNPTTGEKLTPGTESWVQKKWNKLVSWLMSVPR